MKINGKNIKWLYMRVTNDEFELPIAVADSPAELGRMLGIKGESVTQQLSRGRSIYKKVWVGDEE